MNTLAWNNNIGLRPIYWFWDEVMIDRDSWGCFYYVVRGEIHGST